MKNNLSKTQIKNIIALIDDEYNTSDIINSYPEIAWEVLKNEGYNVNDKTSFNENYEALDVLLSYKQKLISKEFDVNAHIFVSNKKSDSHMSFNSIEEAFYELIGDDFDLLRTYEKRRGKNEIYYAYKAYLIGGSIYDVLDEKYHQTVSAIYKERGVNL